MDLPCAAASLSLRLACACFPPCIALASVTKLVPALDDIDAATASLAGLLRPEASGLDEIDPIDHLLVDGGLTPLVGVDDVGSSVSAAADLKPVSPPRPTKRARDGAAVVAPGFHECAEQIGQDQQVHLAEPVMCMCSPPPPHGPGCGIRCSSQELYNRISNMEDGVSQNADSDDDFL